MTGRGKEMAQHVLLTKKSGVKVCVNSHWNAGGRAVWADVVQCVP
jgi:hypothetical protein